MPRYHVLQLLQLRLSVASARTGTLDAEFRLRQNLLSMYRTAMIVGASSINRDSTGTTSIKESVHRA